MSRLTLAPWAGSSSSAAGAVTLLKLYQFDTNVTLTGLHLPPHNVVDGRSLALFARVYSETGQPLGGSAEIPMQAAPAQPQEFPLLAPVQLLAGQRYYLGWWNAVANSGLPNANTQSPAPGDVLTGDGLRVTLQQESKFANGDGFPNTNGFGMFWALGMTYATAGDSVGFLGG